MRVIYHPDFPNDVRKFEAHYVTVSGGLAGRFRQELDDALEAIKASPLGAGHFLNLGSSVVRAMRRRNRFRFSYCMQPLATAFCSAPSCRADLIL
jgi:hypothetical protein